MYSSPLPQEVIGNESAKAHVHICILGNFDLRVEGQSLSEKIGRSAKLRSVLCYLVLHRNRAVTQTELIETFWEDEKQRNPLGALKMQILRIRNALEPLLDEGTMPIISHRGSYQWNPALSCVVDAEEFERLCLEAEQPELPSAEKLLRYQQAVAIYKGEPVLEKANLSWVVPLISRYHSRYIVAIKKYAKLLEQCKDYSEMEEVCLKALEAEPTNEELHILEIQALLRQNKQMEAQKHYKTAADILYRDLGVHPSQQLRELYPLTVKEEAVCESDIDLVMESMRNPPGERNAFLCSFEQFKSIYQLEVRRTRRVGGCLHVAMITVSGADGDVLLTNIMDVVMEQVQKAIIHTLRQSDVVARYGKCQFIVMLPYANLEDSFGVMKRVIEAYHAHNPKNVIQLTYQIRELELA